MKPFRGLAYPTHCAFSMYQYWDHGEAELASGECLSLRQVAGPTTVVTALPSCMLKCLQLGSWETSTIHQQMASVISAKSWVCKKQGVDLMFKTGRVCQLEWRTLRQATNACFTQGTVTSLKRFMNHEESLWRWDPTPVVKCYESRRSKPSSYRGTSKPPAQGMLKVSQWSRRSPVLNCWCKDRRSRIGKVCSSGFIWKCDEKSKFNGRNHDYHSFSRNFPAQKFFKVMMTGGLPLWVYPKSDHARCLRSVPDSLELVVGRTAQPPSFWDALVPEHLGCRWTAMMRSGV